LFPAENVRRQDEKETAPDVIANPTSLGRPRPLAVGEAHPPRTSARANGPGRVSGVGRNLYGHFVDSAHESPYQVALACAGVVILFSAYAWKEFREIGSIRHFLHGLSDQPASEGRPAEFEKVFDTIVRSQSRFRELIDSLDYALFTLSPDGVFRVANRSCAETLGVSFQDLIGHRLEEFISEPSQDGRAEFAGAAPERIVVRGGAGAVRENAQIGIFRRLPARPDRTARWWM
jgi:PAS domain-containing protein